MAPHTGGSPLLMCARDMVTNVRSFGKKLVRESVLPEFKGIACRFASETRLVNTFCLYEDVSHLASVECGFSTAL
jgi:hypothetical protein